jgi:hypothetical protein
MAREMMADLETLLEILALMGLAVVVALEQEVLKELLTAAATAATVYSLVLVGFRHITAVVAQEVLIMEPLELLD